MTARDIQNAASADDGKRAAQNTKVYSSSGPAGGNTGVLGGMVTRASRGSLGASKAPADFPQGTAVHLKPWPPLVARQGAPVLCVTVPSSLSSDSEVCLAGV